MKRALITGASSGFGREFAFQLAEKNYDLALVARREEALLLVKNEIQRSFSVEVSAIPMDLKIKEQILTLPEKAGAVDLLVNSAGYGFMKDFQECDTSDEQAMLDLNVKSLHLLCRLFGEKMSKKRKGGIINIASISSFLPVPVFSAYAASKAFVFSYSQGINMELRRHGVHVMALCPGFSETGFFTETQLANLRRKSRNLPVFLSPQRVVKEGLQAFFRGRSYFIPGAFNRLVVFLAETAPRWVTLRVTQNLMYYLVDSPFHEQG